MDTGNSSPYSALLKLPGVYSTFGGIIRADTKMYGMALERLPLIPPIWSMAGPPPLTAKEASTMRSSQTIIDHHQKWLGMYRLDAPLAEVLHHLHRLREAQCTQEELRASLGPRWVQLMIFGVHKMPWQEVLAFRRAQNSVAIRLLSTSKPSHQEAINLHLRQLEEDDKMEEYLFAAANTFYSGQTDGHGWSWRSG